AVRDDGGEELRDGADADQAVTVWDLIQQAREMAAWTSRYRDERGEVQEVIAMDPDDVTVAEMIGYLQGCLGAQNGVVEGVELLERQPNASRRSTLFLGMLEMARDQVLEIDQEDAFGKLWLRTPKV